MSDKNSERWGFPLALFFAALLTFMFWVADVRLDELKARIEAIEARLPKPGRATQ